MSILRRLVARLGIDCGLPAAGAQRAWLAADAWGDSIPWPPEADLDYDDAPDFPAGVESTPAPPAGACRHCSLPSWVVHCPNGVTQAMCQHHGFISTERK